MQIAATQVRGLSRFLLEVALDDARIRERFAARLLAERAKRGAGIARRYPQSEMAALLKTTLRNYQSWEGGHHLPSWKKLDEIATILGTSVSELLGQDDDGRTPPATPEPGPRSPTLDDLDARVARIEERLRDLPDEIARSLREPA